MPVKNVVLQLDTEYLKAEAKARGVSRTRLTQALMEIVIEQKLVPSIIGDRSVAVPRQQHYRRFKPAGPPGA